MRLSPQPYPSLWLSIYLSDCWFNGSLSPLGCKHIGSEFWVCLFTALSPVLSRVWYTPGAHMYLVGIWKDRWMDGGGGWMDGGMGIDRLVDRWIDQKRLFRGGKCQICNEQWAPGCKRIYLEGKEVLLPPNFKAVTKLSQLWQSCHREVCCDLRMTGESGSWVRLPWVFGFPTPPPSGQVVFCTGKDVNQELEPVLRTKAPCFARVPLAPSSPGTSLHLGLLIPTVITSSWKVLMKMEMCCFRKIVEI